MPVKGLDDAGRGLRADRGRAAAVAAAGGGRARPHPLRRAGGRAGAASRRRSGGPRPGTARSSRWSASRASGKSRLVWEVTHSHRTHGWLVVQAGSVSYGKATPYLPVIDLLKGYFQIEDRDDPRDDPREGHRQAPDAGPSAGADAAGPPGAARRAGRGRRSGRRSTRRSAASAPWTRSSGSCCARARSSRCCWSSRTSTGSTPRPRRCSTAWSRACRRPAPAAGELPPGVRAPLGQQDLLHPASARPAAAGERRGAARRAARAPTPSLEPLKRLLIERTEGNPFFLEESVRTLVETRRAGRRARRLPAGASRCRASRCRRRSRRSWPPGSTGCRRRRSGCSRRPPSSARTCRSPCSRPIAELPEDELRHGLAHLQAGRVPLRDEPLPRAGVHVQARPDPRGGVRQPAPGPAARPPRAGSSRRSRRSTPTAWPSTSSGWPTTRSGASSGRRRCTISGRPGSRRSRDPPTRTPRPVWSRAWPSSADCPRRARPSNRPSTFASTCEPP